jgi:hypothetical protein
MVHWIQARLAWEHPREWGVLEEVQEQVITVRVSDRIARYRNHQVEALLDVAEHGSSVLVSARYGTLSVPSDHGSLWCFCIADADEPWRACSVAPVGPVSYEDLVDRLEDRGGFSIPGALLPLSDGMPKGVDEGACTTMIRPRFSRSPRVALLHGAGWRPQREGEGRESTSQDAGLGARVTQAGRPPSGASRPRQIGSPQVTGRSGGNGNR